MQHKLIVFYNLDQKCLLRGTNWVFKYNSLLFACKGLMLTFEVYFVFLSYYALYYVSAKAQKTTKYVNFGHENLKSYLCT